MGGSTVIYGISEIVPKNLSEKCEKLEKNS